MRTIALITFIALGVVFVWHVVCLVKEFNEKPAGDGEDIGDE